MPHSCNTCPLMSLESPLNVKYFDQQKPVVQIFFSPTHPQTHRNTKQNSNFYIFFSSLLRNCFLCWDRWNGEVTFDAALLCSSRAGSDLVRESGLGWRALSIGFLHSQVEVDAFPKVRQGDAVWGTISPILGWVLHSQVITPPPTAGMHRDLRVSIHQCPKMWSN